MATIAYTKSDSSKVRSLNVYLSQYFCTAEKSPRTEKFHLPSIDKSEQRRRKGKRVSTRYPFHAPNPIDFPQLTARGKKTDMVTLTKENERFYDHHAPPPSPSDEQIERLFYELNRPERVSYRADGFVPYRLPALRRTTEILFI